MPPYTATESGRNGLGPENLRHKYVKTRSSAIAE